MLLGKRARHPMKRTTSMTEFSYDDLSILHPSQSQPSDHLLPPVDRDHHNRNHNHNSYSSNPRVMALVSPRPINRRNSADFSFQSSTTFLTTCSLCNRRLAPGRDIYMYRGDSAFCSLECRQEQMVHDDRREKEKMNQSKPSHSSAAAAGGSYVSSSPHAVTVTVTETLAAS